MRKAITAVLGVATVVMPGATVAAAATRQTATTTVTPKKKVATVTKAVTGSPGSAGRWGDVEVTLVVKKTTTTIGTKKTVKRSITNLRIPVYPDHTDRSVFINQQALPMLMQEVMTAQFNPNIQMISGATDSSQAFMQSLQAALLAAQKV